MEDFLPLNRTDDAMPPCQGSRATWHRALVWLIVAVASLSVAAQAAETNPPAVVKVSGFGLLGNREMVRLLKNFQPDHRHPTIIARSFVEDAALVLFSRAESQGYLGPSLRARFTMMDGSTQRIEWTNALAIQLPREFAAHAARFRMHPGVRAYYQRIEIQGLKAIPEREARSYFVSGDILLSPHSTRAFSPDLLKNSLGALKEALVRKGFRDAVVTTNLLEWNQTTGAVTLQVNVAEGLRTIVRSVNVEIASPENQAVTNHSLRAVGSAPEATLHPNQPYSYLWQQDLARQLQDKQYSQGHPDASVKFAVRGRETNTASVQLDLTARVETGPLVHLGEVIFSGNKRTRSSVLESRVNLTEGSLLNPVAVEKSRQSLARLGVFDSVGLRYEEVDATNRNVVFEFKETKPMSLSLLAGYGSYELLRAGLDFEHRNVLGLAHGLHVRASQSFKATRGDLQYTVPEVFDENLNLFLKASSLRREEVSFTREEYGASVGAQKRLDAIRTDLSVHYDYEFLNALDVNTAATNRIGVQEARATTFNLELNHDRRDNPLLPRQGLKLFSKFEFASAALGGEVDYQRIILSGSYHLDLRGGRLLHLGLTHGMTFTAGGNREELPFNKRFFPGGENSLRGYQEGEASPLDANGEQLGAETYTQANFEFEQLLTKTWSLVTFMDAVGFAQDRSHYPWDETLYSVGGGIRWRTLIGPVRLEYGHNLNPRQHDPKGTLHFSIGFPF